MTAVCKEKPVHIKTRTVLDQSVAGMKTLLLVDDEKSILELCKEFLEQEGYNVLIANAPAAAIRIAVCHDETIHMLITDIMMPGMNGVELAERLSYIRPEMKCIFISGYSPEAIFSSEMFEKNINFMKKPFLLKNFAEKISNVMNQ